MKKIVSILLAATLFLTLFGATGAVAESNAEPVTITVWTMYAEDADTTKPYSRMQTWAEEFNASHDDIQVVVEGGKTSDVILTAVSSGETPDIFQNYWQYAPSYAEAGAIVELTDYVNGDAAWDKDDFLSSVWNLCSYGDSVYSIPFTASSTYIIYNPSLLAANGYDSFPDNMDDLLQCILDCTVMDGSTISVAGLVPTFPWQDDVLWPVAYGAQWYDADGNVDFNNEAMGKAYTFQKTIIDALGGYNSVAAWVSDYGSTRATTSDPILTGIAAMRFQSDSGLASFEAAADEAGAVYGTDYAVAALPYSMLTAGVWEINANTVDADAAWEVLSSLTSAENMAFMAEGDSYKGAFMPRTSALEALLNMDVSAIVKDAASMLLTADLRSFPMSAYVNGYLTSINSNMAEYLAGTTSLEDAMAAVQSEVTAIQAEYEN